MSGPTLRNIGILAHVDAGKTTLTERLLHASGALRIPGSVDAGTACTDDLEVERRRGISVRAALASFEWRGHRFNLVDTPGHGDFAGEVERTLSVLDGAVLVVSAAEGVQAQTEVLWEALAALGLPTLFFLNKVDRVGADLPGVLGQIRRLLTPRAVPLQTLAGAGTDRLFLRDLSDPANPEAAAGLFEALADLDEDLMEAYLEGRTLPPEELLRRAEPHARRGRLFPLLFGAALDGLGVELLLDGLVRFLPPAGGDPEAPTSARAFKVVHDPALGRGVYVRVHRGTLRTRDALPLPGREEPGKVTRIRRAGAGRWEDVSALEAGDLGLVFGLGEARTGDALGDPEGLPGGVPLAEPLFSVRAVPPTPEDAPRLLAALRVLSDEDPHLGLVLDRERQEMHLRILGPLQVEILTALLSDRFGLAATFEKPATLYKETLQEAAEGYVEYTLPKPCWAVLRFLVEPGERGSGVVYRSRVSTDDVKLKYQREVERTLPAALEQGLLGWEVTDLRITLLEGEDHEVHSRPTDFAIATPMGIFDALQKGGTRLLEPVLRFSLAAPEEAAGAVLGDLLRMRGTFDAPRVEEGVFRVEGTLPAEPCGDYAVRLGSLTGGRGRFSTRFAGYRDCPEEIRAEAPRRSVSPLDRARYILAARGALG